VRNYRTGLFRDTRFRKRQISIAIFAIPCREVCICYPVQQSGKCYPLQATYSVSSFLYSIECRVGRGWLSPSSVRSVNRYIRFSRIPLSDMVSFRYSFKTQIWYKMHLLNCTFCLHSLRILRIQIQGLSPRELSFLCNLLTNSIPSLKFHKASRLPH